MTKEQLDKLIRVQCECTNRLLNALALNARWGLGGRDTEDRIRAETFSTPEIERLCSE